MRVLEVSRGAAAGYAGVLLSELGYRVDRLELSESSIGSDPFLHRDKHSIKEIEDIGLYDALVEDVGKRMLRRLGLSYRSLRRRYPDLVIVSLSPHGLFGPMAEREATELTTQAASGVLHCCGYREEAPRKLPGDTAAMIAGLHGATAAVTGFMGVRSGVERGAHIDISAQDTLMHHWTRHVAQYAYSGVRLRRERRDPEGIHARHTVRAKDGWVYMLALQVPWQDVAAFLGLGRFIDFREDNRQPWAEMEAPFLDVMASKSKYEWFAEAAAMDWTFAPVEDPFQVMTNPQSRARGFFGLREIAGREIPLPGLPFRIDEETTDE